MVSVKEFLAFKILCDLGVVDSRYSYATFLNRERLSETPLEWIQQSPWRSQKAGVVYHISFSWRELAPGPECLVGSVSGTSVVGSCLYHPPWRELQEACSLNHIHKSSATCITELSYKIQNCLKLTVAYHPYSPREKQHSECQCEGR